MTVKTETNFWKSVKKLLENGEEKYLVSRIESYATPGFPDCIVFHRDTGFFTLELKIMQPNGKIRISPLQSAWNKWWGGSGAPVFILVDLPAAPKGRWVKLFPGRLAQELREKTIDAVPGLYEGRLADLDLVKLLNSQTL
tara:strand:+ start:59 stop:478 length:420 start_codon:yes stop_codon:yes gene_type:complete